MVAIKSSRIAIKYNNCSGGFCELPKKKRIPYIHFLSKGEGKAPPFKMENAYKLKYASVSSHMYQPIVLMWMSRYLYTSP